jgi:hypothetical protein
MEQTAGIPDYIPRHLQESLNLALKDTPVVCLLGPRQCGKSTLAKHQAPDRVFISLDDARYLDLARTDAVPQVLFGEQSNRTFHLVAGDFFDWQHGRLILIAGHTRSFSGLLERLDPVRFTRTSEMSDAERKRVRDVNGLSEKRAGEVADHMIRERSYEMGRLALRALSEVRKNGGISRFLQQTDERGEGQ